jgi:hypothetical protein
MKRTPLQRRTPLRARKTLRSGPLKGVREQLPSLYYPAGARRLRTRIAQPNTRERAWREAVRSLGSIIDADPRVEIHHCVGRTGRHEGVAIGHWWILPLTREQHQGRNGIHAHPDRKAREKSLFERVLICIQARDPETPLPPPHVIDAIRRYRR